MNLLDLIKLIKSNTVFIFCTVLIFNILAIVLFFNLEPKYSSSILISDVIEDQSSNSLNSVLGDTPLNIMNNSRDNQESMLILQSNSFITSFLLSRDLIGFIYAGEKYNSSSKEISYNKLKIKEIESINSRKDLYNNSGLTLQIIHNWKDVFQLNENIKPGFHEIKISTLSPLLSSNIAEWIVEDLNEYIRLKDLEESSKLIDFLYNKLEDLVLEGEKEIIYSLIQKNTEKNTYANVKNEYVLKVIDPPIKANSPSFPKLNILIILASFLALILSFTTIFLRFFLSLDSS